MNNIWQWFSLKEFKKMRRNERSNVLKQKKLQGKFFKHTEKGKNLIKPFRVRSSSFVRSWVSEWETERETERDFDWSIKSERVLVNLVLSFWERVLGNLVLSFQTNIHQEAGSILSCTHVNPLQGFCSWKKDYQFFHKEFLISKGIGISFMSLLIRVQWWTLFNSLK